MTSASQRQRLLRVASALRAGTPADPRDAIPVADVFDAFLCGDLADLPLALGIKPLAGERSWATKTAQVERDRHIALAVRFCSATSPAAQAAELASAWARYEVGAWRRRDRMLPACPYSGGLELHLYHATRLLPGGALSARTIREILSRNNSAADDGGELRAIRRQTD